MAAVLVWIGRFFVNPDGISYLDLSEDFANGRWDSAVNAHWSPAYPALLALWLAPFSSGSQWEPIAVHVLNGFLFLVALGSFELFLRAVERHRESPLTPPVRFACYMVVLWCLVVLITIRVVTPDMMLAALGFLIAAVFTQIQSRKERLRTYVLFGALLGAAALTKSLMLSVGIVFLLFSIVANRKTPGAMRRHLVSIAVFAVIVLPQLAVVSMQKGRLTFSDSGKLVYALKVNEISKFWAGPHVRVMSEKPRVLHYPTDKANRTYPLWDDPSFWYQGAPVRFNLSDQLAATTRNLRTDAGIALKILLPLLCVFVGRDRRFRMRNSSLALIALMVIGLYAMLYSEARLIGFWVALLTVSVLTGVTIGGESARQRAGPIFVNLIALIAVISFVTYVLDQAFSSRPHRGFNARDLQLEVARKVRELGIRPGSRVALVGDESDIYWARLAQVQVATQIPLPDAPAYWSMSNQARDSLNWQMSLTGTSAVVASWTDPPPSLSSWIRVPGTRYSILPLNVNR